MREFDQVDDKKPKRVAPAKGGKASSAPAVPDADLRRTRKSPEAMAAVDFVQPLDLSETSAIAQSAVLSDDALGLPVVAASPLEDVSVENVQVEEPSIETVAHAAGQTAAEPVAEAEDQNSIEASTPEHDVAAREALTPEPEATAVEAPMSEPDAPIVAASSTITDPAAEAAAAPGDTPPPPQSPRVTGPTFIQSHKDMIMDMTTNFGSGINDVMSGAQDKAKEAFEKGSSMMGEVGSFARGNVEAVVESGKILAAGLQDMTTSMVAEGRTSFETMTADLKELAASKTPADFFKAQSEIMRKSLDSAVATGSKNSEAMLKLVSDMMAPLSGRMNLAAEKVKMPLA